MDNHLKLSSILTPKVRFLLYLSSLSTLLFSQNYCINVCPFIDGLSFGSLTFNLFVIFIFHIIVREFLYNFFSKVPHSLTLPRYAYYVSIISWMIAGVGAFILHASLYSHFPVGSHLKLLSSYWVLGAGILAQLEYIIFEQQYKKVTNELYLVSFNENISRRIFESFIILSAAPSITIMLILARYRHESLQGSHILEEISYVVILFISVAVICAYYFGKMLKKDTQMVLNNIHEVKHSNYNIKHNIARADEIGEISQAIESMAHEIGTLNDEIISTQTEVVNTMGEIAETRSKETGNHVKRVALFSELLALKYGFSASEANLLKQASPMHDIGKIGIPDIILNKPGRHSDEEFAIMKTHATLGYDILKNSNRDILKAAAIVAHEHHEKYDGSGYPRGLSGEDIHIYGRITAVADVFDALGSERVYKKAWDDERIFALFKDQSGKHFDPVLVDLFFENLDEILSIRDRLQDKME